MRDKAVQSIVLGNDIHSRMPVSQLLFDTKTNQRPHGKYITQSAEHTASSAISTSATQMQAKAIHIQLHCFLPVQCACGH